MAFKRSAVRSRLSPPENKARKCKLSSLFFIICSIICTAALQGQGADRSGNGLITLASISSSKKLHPTGAPSVRKVSQGGSCISIKFVSLKRCNPCGYAVFSLLRSARCCWKASSISSGVSSWRMPTPL